MTITIYGSDYDALWQEANSPSQNVESEGVCEILQSVPECLGQGYVQSIYLHGIKLLLFNYQLHEDLFIIRKGQETTKIFREFGFNLSGDRHGICTGENFVEWGSLYEPDKDIPITYARSPILKVDIHLESADLLGQTIAEVIEKLPAQTKQRVSNFNYSGLGEKDCITPTMRSALRQILHCPYEGKTKQIYLESKCLELITLKLEQLTQRDKQTAKLHSLNSDNIDRIHLAKDIIISNFDNPPSLIDLAREIGLNDCTLKRGFREVFGTTVFGYLHDYRLEQACQLLQEHRLDVSVIAERVGFSNYRSLSRAFRKKYGVTPKQYQI